MRFSNFIEYEQLLCEWNNGLAFSMLRLNHWKTFVFFLSFQIYYSVYKNFAFMILLSFYSFRLILANPSFNTLKKKNWLFFRIFPIQAIVSNMNTGTDCNGFVCLSVRAQHRSHSWKSKRLTALRLHSFAVICFSRFFPSLLFTLNILDSCYVAVYCAYVHWIIKSRLKLISCTKCQIDTQWAIKQSQIPLFLNFI